MPCSMKKSNHKLIGGKFGLPQFFLTTPSLPGFLSGDPILLFNARSAIKLIVDQLRPRTVWLPSYLCPTILTAIDTNLSDVKYYSLNEHLIVISDDFLPEIQPNDLFICIDFFGFQFEQSVLEEVKQSGCKILRDCSQALFFDFQKDSISDYHVFSPRKFLGIPDGGILHAQNKVELSADDFTPPDEQAVANLLQAVILRREFDIYGENREWYEFFKKGESFLKPSYSFMSDLSRILLKFGFNYETIQTRRKKNYQNLAMKLNHLALFPSLPEDVVPLGFPIVLPNRDDIRIRLYEYDIYPPIHWEISSVVPTMFKESHKLAQQIMTLPCDQRYDEEDMNFIADCLLRLVI